MRWLYNTPLEGPVLPLPESQQQFLVDVMQQHPNPQVTAVLDTVRRSKMDDILARGQQAGSAFDPKLSLSNIT